MVEVMKIIVTSLKRSHACTATVHALNPAVGHHQPMQETPRHTQQVWVSFLWGLCSFSWVLVHKFLLCPPRVCFPVLCKFWQLYGEVNGDLLQEDLCHTHTQSTCPCSRPLPTHTSTRGAQTQFCLSLCWVPGSWCTQDSFEPSEHLWKELGLILNVNLPLLPSCWGFSCAFGHGISPHICSTAYCLIGVSRTLDMGYLYTVSQAKHSHHS